MFKKPIILILFLIAASASLVQAQNKGTGFGIKAGLNYNTTGKYFKDAGTIWDDPGASSGYHIGGFFKMGNYDAFLRPELLFTRTKFDVGNDIAKVSRLDAPVLVGFHFFEVITVMGGPSFHYTLSDNYSQTIEGIENDPLRFGFQLGLGISVGPVGLDLRYEKEFNDQQINLERIVFGTENFKSEQLVLGLSFQF